MSGEWYLVQCTIDRIVSYTYTCVLTVGIITQDNGKNGMVVEATKGGSGGIRFSKVDGQLRLENW